MSEPAPGHVSDMQQSIHAVEINKCTEIGDVFHGPNYAITDVHALQELLALFATLLFDYLASAEHDVLSIVIQFDDFEIVSVANELLQILWRNDIDLRRWQKCLNPDVHHQAAFHDRSNLAFDQPIILENSNDLVPILPVGGFFLGQDNHAFIVFQPFQQDVHFV